MNKLLENVAYAPVPCHSRKIEATVNLIIMLLRCLDTEGLSKFQRFEKNAGFCPN